MPFDEECREKSIATRAKNKLLRNELKEKGVKFSGNTPLVNDPLSMELLEEAFRTLDEEATEATPSDEESIPLRRLLHIVKQQVEADGELPARQPHGSISQNPVMKRKTRWSHVNDAINKRDLSEVCWCLTEIAVRDLREKGFVEIESLNLKEILRLTTANNDRKLDTQSASDKTAKQVADAKIKNWLRQV